LKHNTFIANNFSLSLLPKISLNKHNDSLQNEIR
jgi:hypothetical protein